MKTALETFPTALVEHKPLEAITEPSDAKYFYLLYSQVLRNRQQVADDLEIEQSLTYVN